MPGLDQRGPEGRGAMTGRQQGFCRRTGTDQDRQAYGFSGGRGGQRGCRRNGAGRSFSAGPVQPPDTRASLRDKVSILEDELNAVKDQLNAMSD